MEGLHEDESEPVTRHVLQKDGYSANGGRVVLRTNAHRLSVCKRVQTHT